MHHFLISAVDGTVCSKSSPGSFTSVEEAMEATELEA
jgi:hypothetical protein